MVLLIDGTEIGPAAQVRSTPVPASAYAFTSKGSTRARTRNLSGEAGPMSRRLTHKMSFIASQPEFNLFMFGVLLNYAWELTQAPLYGGVATASYWTVVKGCARATAGDGLILLVAYWSVAAVARDRRWFACLTLLRLAVFVSVGLAITIGLERLALQSPFNGWGWTYAESIPLVPGIGVGLTPLLQWLILPLGTIWLVRRQLQA